jgi:hypothetical protein
MRKKIVIKRIISGNVQEHLVNMDNTDGSVQSYATEAEIVAASELFNVDIFIQTLVNTKREWTKYSLYDKCEHSKTYVVILHEHEHFKVLNKIARPCKCNYSPHYQRNKNDKKNEIKHDNKGNNVKTMTDTSKTSQIYNFYQKKLNSVQCRLLSKGLRFVQTKKNVDIGKHIADLKLWERRMRLREFVYQQNESFDEGNSGNSDNSGKTKTQKEKYEYG